MSDATCIGLQLVNFWQDVARDLRDRDRVYLPREDMDRLGVTEDDLRRPAASEAVRELIALEVERARGYLLEGEPLYRFVPRRVALDLRMFSAGGLALCDAIAAQGYDTLTPAAGPGEARARPDRGGRGAADRRTGAPVTLALEEAYDACRDIAREEARNFYYGFILLPPERRAGIYAAYAFSRRADDSVDDEGSPAGKLAAVADRRDELDACYAGEPPADDPVLVALTDTVRRFDVPRAHLDALLDGVAMDLTVSRYPDFPALKEYCDRVAGAVGLVSLHIFGFSDPRAPDHAADLGVAMQLVNIMRDVAEDAERDRIYLPADEMAAHGVSEEDLMDGVATRRLPGPDARAGRAGARLLRPRRAAAAAARPARPHVRLDALRPLPGDPRRDRGARLRRLRRPGLAVDAPQAGPDGPADRPRPEVTRPRIVVCGGGLAGVAAAVEAAGLGAEVTLVERRPFLGGKAFSFTDRESGREVDNGQHVFLGCCPAYMRLLRLLGTLGDTSLQRRLDAPVRDRAGRVGALRAGPLPAPLHLGRLLRDLPPPVAAREGRRPARPGGARGDVRARAGRPRRRHLRRLARRPRPAAGGGAALLGPDRPADLQRPQRARLGGPGGVRLPARVPAERRTGRRSAGRASG